MELRQMSLSLIEPQPFAECSVVKQLTFVGAGWYQDGWAEDFGAADPSDTAVTLVTLAEVAGMAAFPQQSSETPSSFGQQFPSSPSAAHPSLAAQLAPTDIDASNGAAPRVAPRSSCPETFSPGVAAPTGTHCE
mmetsp:Transcript_18093/g.31704  ORF Transcript_18093/g.31704 Transcript_18093/m.31704 type:complete len:134 (+) Transcript_18093:2825-3226(+)